MGVLGGGGGGGLLCALYSLYSMIKIRRVCSCGLCLVPRTSLVKFTMLLQCVSITEQKLIHLQTRQRGRQVVNSILCTVCTMCTSCCVFFSIASASMIQSVSTYARTCQRVYLWCIIQFSNINQSRIKWIFAKENIGMNIFKLASMSHMAVFFSTSVAR